MTRTLCRSLLAHYCWLWLPLIAASTVGRGQEGQVDLTFDPSITTGDAVTALLFDESARLWVGTYVRTGSTTRLYRLTAGGAIDPTFEVQFGLPTEGGGVWRMLSLPGGDTLVGGRFASVNGVPHAGLVRLRPDGSIAPHFNAGMAADALITAISLGPDGRLYVGGRFTTIGGGTRHAIARLTWGGMLDETFDAGPHPVPGRLGATENFENVVTGIVPEPNAVAIAATRLNNTTFVLGDEGRMVRRGLNGELGNSYGAVEGGSAVNQVVVLPTGSILMACDGGEAVVSDIGDPTLWDNLRRIELDLELPQQAVELGSAQALLVYGDGRVLVGGSFSHAYVKRRASLDYDVYPRPGLIRLAADLQFEPTYNPGNGVAGLSSDYSINCLAFAPDGKVVVGGEFASFGGQNRRNLVRLHGNAEWPTIVRQPVSVNTIPDSIVQLRVQAGGTPPLQYQWEKDGIDLPGRTRPQLALPRAQSADAGVYRVRVTSSAGTTISDPAPVNVDATVGLTNGVAVPILRDSGFGLWALGVEPDHSFYLMSGGKVTHYLADGVVDPLFATTPTSLYSGSARASVRCDDGSYWIGGNFQFNDGHYPYTLIRMSREGVFTHVAGLSDYLQSTWRLEWQPGRGVLAWGALPVGPATLFRMSRQGVIDSTFSPDEYVRDLRTQVGPDGTLYAIDATFSYIRRYTADGQFSSQVRYSPTHALDPRGFTLQPDGKYLIFQQGNPAVARFHADGTADVSFAPPGFGGSVDRMDLMPDGSIWIGGSFETVGGLPRRDVVRLRSEGSVDTTFNLLQSHPSWVDEFPRILSVSRHAAAPGVLIGSDDPHFWNEALWYAPLERQSGRLINLSTRGLVGQDADTLIAGFAVAAENDAELPVLMRGVGPGLQAFVANFASDPQLRLFADATHIASNNDWGETDAAGIIAASETVFAFPLGNGSLDAAMRRNLPHGTATVHLLHTGTPAIGLIEVYEVGSSPGVRLSNVSTRSRVGQGDNVLIAGFVISDGPKNVLVRAIGSGLAQFGVNNLLADPRLRLFRGNTQIAENDDWVASPMVDLIDHAGQATGAFASDPTAREAAWAGTLTTGSYTVIVSGSDDSSGVALVEVYVLDW